MGKNNGKILAFVHFLVTETRTIWLLWYTVYSTFEGILTGTAITTAYRDHDTTRCLHDEVLTVNDIEDCAKSAFRRYLATGPQIPFDECGEHCEGAGVGIDVSEPRIMFFFMTLWLFGFLLVLLIYFFYRHPDYHTGSYINCTQTLYASKAYKIVSICTFAVSVIVILIGIYILIRQNEDWTQYIVALILMVVASRSLVRDKSNGLDINSEKFCQLKISHGNTLMMVLNLFLTTNADLLDELEVQVMKKGLSRDVAAAPDERKEGCKAIFEWYPLSDESLSDFLASAQENSSHEMTEKV